MTNSKSNKMTFWEHIDELRFRILSSLLVILIFTLFSYFFADIILDFIRYPIIDILDNNSNIQEAFNSITSPLFLYISVSFYSGVFLSLPFILYNSLRFIFPAINKKNFIFLSCTIFFSVLLFIVGVFLSYRILFPISVKFLVKFLPPNNQIPLFIFVNEYVSLIFTVMIAVGLIFQLPIIALFLSRLKLINSKILSSKRRYAILVSFIFSAIITPPDIISQVILSIPVIILYEICIIITKIFNKNDEK